MARTALVTGGARRIGRALSLGLAEAGFDVVVNYHESEGEARDVVRKIEAMGQRAIAVQGDMSASADVAALADRLRSEFGRLDLLVNNASIFQPRKLLEVEEAEWDRVMAVNLKAPFLVLKATADLLEEAGGNVVNLVDLSAMQPWTDYAHHAVSKAGLLHLTRVMARAMAPRVRVNAIAPGSVLPPEDAGPSYRERSKEKAALGTLGTPEDVVRTVLFLHRSPFITGEVVVVDGGRMLGS
jgi:pteridine reductase